MAAYTTIDDPGIYFNSVLYTGDQPNDVNVTGVGFSPDLVWVKNRPTAGKNLLLFDTVRGVGLSVYSNTTGSEVTDAAGMKSFDADGFTVGDWSEPNESGDSYASWNWKAGTTSGITTDGSTTITPGAYSFNQAAGFSIIEYTGTGAVATLAHGLGAVPKMIATKQTDGTRSWTIYNVGMDGAGGDPEDYSMRWNTTAAKDDSDGYWNDTVPDSVNFDLGSSADVNVSGGTYICYCWAPKQVYSIMGPYEGNGNLDGTFVYCGFRPAYIMAKRSASADNWGVWDYTREGYNDANDYLKPNSTIEEEGNILMDIVSNGFKWRTTDAAVNAAGAEYIYMAFAHSPLVNSNGVPCNAR